MIRWLVAFGLLPVAVPAAPMQGDWCAPDYGPAYFLRLDGLGVGEHTMCEWADPPEGRALVTTIHCVEYYFPEGEPLAVNPRDLAIALRLRDDGRLWMQVGQEDAIVLERCDED